MKNKIDQKLEKRMIEEFFLDFEVSMDASQDMENAVIGKGQATS